MPRFNPCNSCCHSPDRCCLCCSSDLPNQVCINLTSSIVQNIQIQLVYLKTVSGQDIYIGYAYWCFNYTTFFLVVSCQNLPNGNPINGLIGFLQNPYSYPLASTGPPSLFTLSGPLTCQLEGTLVNFGSTITATLSQNSGCTFSEGSFTDSCFSGCINGATIASINVNNTYDVGGSDSITGHFDSGFSSYGVGDCQGSILGFVRDSDNLSFCNLACGLPTYGVFTFNQTIGFASNYSKISDSITFNSDGTFSGTTVDTFNTGLGQLIRTATISGTITCNL